MIGQNTQAVGIGHLAGLLGHCDYLKEYEEPREKQRDISSTMRASFRHYFGAFSVWIHIHEVEDRFSHAR